MPKEVIQHPFQVNEFFGSELSVHWSKETGEVQIGLTRHVKGPVDPGSTCSPVHSDHQHCNECRVAVERNEKRRGEGQPEMVTSCGSTSPAPPVGEFDGPATVFTAPLTRRELNTMILVFRRARDQAFGADA